MTYLTELAVDFANASSLIPLEITQAPALGEMAKDEFINGWKKVYVYHFLYGSICTADLLTDYDQG
jgi:hypothetical protein